MKRIKTLIVLTMAFGAITFSSCKKDKQAPPTGISADIDGTATTFNVHAIAGKGTVDGGTFTTISGADAKGNVISITLLGTVTAGKTYSAATTPDAEPLIDYSIPGTDADFLNDDSASKRVSVTVNSVSSTSISGTFSGGLVEADIQVGNDNTPPPTKSIANGKFNVSITTVPIQQ